MFPPEEVVVVEVVVPEVLLEVRATSREDWEPHAERATTLITKDADFKVKDKFFIMLLSLTLR